MSGLFTFCDTHPSRTVLRLKLHPQPASQIIFLAGIIGLAWAYAQFSLIAKIEIVSQSGSGETQPLTGGGDAEKTARLKEIYGVIYEGAESFLAAEYTVCGWFIAVFSIVIFVLVAWGTGWDMARGFFTAISFLLGALTSMVSFRVIVSCQMAVRTVSQSKLSCVSRRVDTWE